MFNSEIFGLTINGMLSTTLTFDQHLSHKLSLFVNRCSNMFPDY
jgi:hypothetical protein